MKPGLSRRRLLVQAGAAATLPLFVLRTRAQAWPSKPIRVVVGYPAGGQTDVFARLYGEYVQQQTGQQWIVENKSGAGGSIAAGEVKRAPADGHTLMFTISTTMIMNRVLYKSIPYDTEKDFALVSIMPSGGLPLVAASKTGATDLKAFIEHAKRNEKTSIGTYAAGSFAHIAVAELNKQYGLKMEPVHYRGEAPMWTDLGAGSIDGAIGSMNAATNILQAGKGKAVALSRKRSAKLPGVATFEEQGAVSRAFSLTGFQCCAAPAGTPKAVLNRLSELLVAAGKGERVQAMMAQFGLDEAALPMDASQKLYDTEAPIWLDLVKSLGLAPE
jgi:tripartite-type tricarboxylate transporter receptor subunit TctC